MKLIFSEDNIGNPYETIFSFFFKYHFLVIFEAKPSFSLIRLAEPRLVKHKSFQLFLNVQRKTQVYIFWIGIFDGRFRLDSSALFVYKRPVRWDLISISSEVWAEHTKLGDNKIEKWLHNDFFYTCGKWG